MQEISRRERERQTREEEILDAAEKLFGNVGAEGASMEEIAKEAQFSRKTIYQYFGSREELQSAVIIRGFRMLLSDYGEVIKEENSGYGKLCSMGRVFNRFYKKHPGFFCLINHSGRIQAVGKESQREEFRKLDEAMFKVVAGAIEEGRADGSIRSGIDPVMAAFSIVFTITGFFYEYSITGKSFTEHLSLDGDRFVQYTLDLFMESLRA